MEAFGEQNYQYGCGAAVQLQDESDSECSSSFVAAQSFLDYKLTAIERDFPVLKAAFRLQQGKQLHDLR